MPKSHTAILPQEGEGASQEVHTLCGNDFRQSEINGGSYRRLARGALERRRNNDISMIDTSDMQYDPVLLLVVDDTPRITRVGVAALPFPMRSLSADLFKAPKMRSLFVSPVVAVHWR